MAGNWLRNGLRQMKQLLIVMHAPSPNTRRLAEAVLAGARHPDIEQVQARWLPPLQTQPEDVLNADAIVLGTTENLGYMAGAMKDFFDRCYYPVLERKQGLPCAVLIRAGHDGTGTRRALTTILTGLKWREVQPSLLCRGDWQEIFVTQAQELGLAMAAGLDAGVF